jgi:HK97 family phage major capsid protein/HK97 family phage prohead protease
MPDRPVPGSVETRAAPDATAPTIEGRRLRGVIPYNVESRDLGGWREVIEPGALRAAKLDDLVATVDHAGVPIGRHPRTLEIEDTATELRWSVELPESRSDVREAVQRGDLRSGSWRMIVAKDRWVGDVRHVEQISELRDVSVVTSPAYSAAVAEYRSAPEPTPPEEEHPVPEPTPTGTLRVEDRAHQPKGTVESRIIDAMAAVPRGEARDLTRASAAPVEPDDLRTALIDKFREASVVAASGVPIVPTDKGKVVFPTLTGDVDAEFYNELEEITESDPTLDDFEVPVKAIKALVRGSSEAFEDSDPSLLQIVQDNINIAMVLKGDRSLVAGSTSTEAKGFDGLLNVTGTQSIAVGGALTWDHVLKAAAMLIEANVPGPYAVLLGPRPALALDLLKETTGQYLGRPVGIPPVFSTGWLPVTTGASPTTSAIVFAPAQQMIVLRRAVTVEVDRSQEFSSDAVLVLGRYRLGLGVPAPQSIVKLTAIAAPAIS